MKRLPLSTSFPLSAWRLAEGPWGSWIEPAPDARLLLHLFVHPKLTHAPVRRLLWLVRRTYRGLEYSPKVTVNLQYYRQNYFRAVLP